MAQRISRGLRLHLATVRQVIGIAMLDIEEGLL